MTAVASSLYRPAGSLADGDWSVVLSPESAGWRFSGMRAGTLAPGGALAFETAGAPAEMRVSGARPSGVRAIAAWT